MTLRFRLQRVLGRGRHADLWLAFDEERREEVALKIAPRGSLRREFETLRAAAGDNVVKAHDCGVLPDGRAFLAMELVRGGDLAHAGLSGDALDSALHAAARALAAVHRRGWVHRDIKPAHLLMRNDGSEGDIVLCDFGSACRIGSREAHARPSVIGTPRYAAPEQIEGGIASPSADVYSLGACAFELLTGQPPFRGETLTELFSQHVCAPVPRLPLRDCAHWQDAIDAMLAKDPARRPADGCAVLEQLALLTGEIS
jgi:serine/threonine-protein kinase